MSPEPRPRHLLNTIVERLWPSIGESDLLRHELRDIHGRLQSVTEHHAAALEELRAARALLSDKLQELDRKDGDLRNLFESADLATLFLDGDLAIRAFTPAVAALYRLVPGDVGRKLTDIAGWLRDTALCEDVRHVLASLQPLERRVAHMDGERHFALRVQPYRGLDGRSDGALVTFADVTDIVRAETHRQLLVDELNHRVRNMLTVVMSLAAQTMRRSTSLAEFATAFTGRIEALTASYTLLSRAQWLSVSLRDVLLEELRPLAAEHREQWSLSGPALQLAPQGALALGMAIHELATNAVRHGALVRPAGRVVVVWRVEGEGGGADLVLEWTERGGPPVEPPARRGFGATLIERGFAHELSGSARLTFARDGVQATLRAPVAATLVASSATLRP